MADSYYVRIRGEVKGPVARSELVSQIRKKRMGRHHEVSTDAVNWVRAGDVPELFEPVVVVREAAAAPIEQASSDTSRAAGLSSRANESVNQTETEWFYAKGRNRLGPVSEGELRTMLATGRVTGSDLVWNQSLDDWLPANQLPQFAGLVPVEAATQISQSDKATGSGGTGRVILTSSLCALQFACLSLLCAPLVAMLTAFIVDSPSFSRTNAGAGMLGMLMVASVFGALPVFSAIAGILTGHHSLRIHRTSGGQYEGSGYSLTALIVCYSVLVITLVTTFVFLIVIGVKSA